MMNQHTVIVAMLLFIAGIITGAMAFVALAVLKGLPQ